MSNKEFSEKLKAGIELAGKRMLEEKALRGEDLIVSSDGKPLDVFLLVRFWQRLRISKLIRISYMFPSCRVHCLYRRW
jgi:hypothetical protein